MLSDEDVETYIRAAHATLVAFPDGSIADAAELFLTKALPARPDLQPILATQRVGMARGDVREAAAQLAPLLPQPTGSV